MTRKLRVWGFGSDVRYVGLLPLGDFVRITAQLNRMPKNWVRNRTAETGNFLECQLARQNPGQVIRI